MLPSSATITPSPTAIREGPAGGVEARGPRDRGGVRVPAHAEPVGVHRRLGHPVVERWAVVARRECRVRLGSQRVQVVAYEIAREIDGTHPLGLEVALLRGRGVGVRTASRIAVGRRQHRGVNRAVYGKAEQAQRLAECRSHLPMLRGVDSNFCTPSAYGVCTG